jgi:glucosamine-6-phosphate deaminase
MNHTQRDFFLGSTRIHIVRTAEEATTLAEALLTLLVIRKPDARIGLATGNTYKDFFARVVASVLAGRYQLKESTFTHLDEYMDVDPNSEGTMADELRHAFFGPLGSLAPKLIPVLATGTDPVAAHIHQIQGSPRLHLQFLGIGHNGHIAFNEPGAPFDRLSHINALTEATVAANRTRFKGAFPKRAITLGIEGILRAESICLLATGAAKAQAVRDMLLGPIHPACPASAIRLHDHAVVILDEDAASGLNTGPRIVRTRPTFQLFDAPTGISGPVLVASPHPDDASISCGGLLASLDPSVRKVILTMTTGSRAKVKNVTDPAAVAALRESEVMEEAKALGCEARFLRGRFYDSGRYEEADVEATLAHLRQIRPRLILVTSRRDAHPTHRMTRVILEEALDRYLHEDRAHGPLDLWTFEGPWHQLATQDVNVLVKYSEEAERRKVTAMLAHRSQMERVPYHEGAKALARLRAISFSELHLKGTEPGHFDVIPLVEAYTRDLCALVAEG